MPGGQAAERAGVVESDGFDPAAELDVVNAATGRLVTSVSALEHSDIGRPSRLPGWTVGHVLAHVARNADGLCNLLGWARTGTETAMYGSRAARDADIDRDADRSPEDHLRDLEDSAARFAAAVAAVPADRWDTTVRTLTGAELPARRLLWGRLREVEVHHVDAAIGYEPADWSDRFAVSAMKELVDGFSRRTDVPALVLRGSDVDRSWRVGADAAPGAALVVTGPVRELFGWLAGRGDGRALDMEPAGAALPSLPAWL